jgi:DNA repair ATPase RecN
MEELKEKLDFTRNQNLELMKLSKKASEEASTLKRELHDANADIRAGKVEFAMKHARQAEGFEKMLDNLKFELRRTIDESARYREYADFEQQVLEACVTKLQGKCKLYREGGKKLRAVLRIPRLTRLYHDLIRRDGLDEFASLDQVYDLHFKTAVGDFSPTRLAETPAVERHLMSRSLNQADLAAAPRLRSSLVDEYPRGQ